MTYVKYLLAGFGIVVLLIVVGVMVPRSERIVEVLLRPGALLITNGPGGKENPLNLLLAVAIQAIIYAIPVRLVFPHWEASDNRQSKSS